MCIKLQIKMILSVCLVQKLEFATEQLEQLEAVWRMVQPSLEIPSKAQCQCNDILQWTNITAVATHCLVCLVVLEVVREPPLICLAGAHLGLAGQRTERTERTEVPRRTRLRTFLSVCNQHPPSPHLTPTASPTPGEVTANYFTWKHYHYMCNMYVIVMANWL